MDNDVVSRVVARHFSSPLGVRQRLTARGSSPGGRRMPGLERRYRTKGLWRLDISPKVLRPVRGRTAVLGRYALGKPGDCMWPDTRYVASDDENVNTADSGPIARAQRGARSIRVSEHHHRMSHFGGHRDGAEECPLSGVKRTSLFDSAMSAFDPNRTSADAVGLSANCRQLGLLDQLVCARDEVRKRLRIRRVCPTSCCPLLAIARATRTPVLSSPASCENS
jgi:hypothetical protein